MRGNRKNALESSVKKEAAPVLTGGKTAGTKVPAFFLSVSKASQSFAPQRELSQKRGFAYFLTELSCALFLFPTHTKPRVLQTKV